MRQGNRVSNAGENNIIKSALLLEITYIETTTSTPLRNEIYKPYNWLDVFAAYMLKSPADKLLTAEKNIMSTVLFHIAARHRLDI